MSLQIKNFLTNASFTGLLLALLLVMATSLLPQTVSAAKKEVWIVSCQGNPPSPVIVKDGKIACQDSSLNPTAIKAGDTPDDPSRQSVVTVDCGDKEVTSVLNGTCDGGKDPDKITATSINLNAKGFVDGRSCGAKDQNYYTPSFDIGCRSKGNPIADAAFAVIRFLSAGVGLVIIGSIVVAGIQYSASRDNPQQVQAAVTRIQSSLFALVIFVFAYAIVNYLVPGTLLK